MFILALPLLFCLTIPATDLEEARTLLRTGKYRECLDAASKALEEDGPDEDWALLKARAALALGELKEARGALEPTITRYRFNLELRLVAHEVLTRMGESIRAGIMLNEIDRRVRVWPRRYGDPEDFVVIGRAKLRSGKDVKKVLDQWFYRARREDGELADARIAIAEVALAKHDYQLAAEELQIALGLIPEDAPQAEVHYLLARAFAPSDPARAARERDQALAINPNHVPTLLDNADQLIAGDRYKEAGELLSNILTIDKESWQAWAYQAVLAHLEGLPELEQTCRATALATWSDNPGVDHLIGRELSEKYRFAEAAEYQRAALEIEPKHVEARFHLALDLLRLGKEDEGWKLAERVLEEDPYQVVAFNLMTLHDRLEQYTTLVRDSFIVRMEEREAKIYGPLVLDLLVRARDVLQEKYRLALEGPILVEIFAEQKDFAIRTFGLPGGAGFLGVCFGDVVTMNSPATQGESPPNWQAVLWHEYTHVITLNKTRNRMPRWLSEGISVYEEMQENPTWGQRMTPPYRERILAGRTTKLSEMGSAFQNPDGPRGLLFAYYASSVAIEWMIDTYGFDALLGILDDLGAGKTMRQSLAERLGPIADVDQAFEAHLRSLAEQLAPNADLTPLPPDSANDLATLATWVAEKPTNVPGLIAYGNALRSSGDVENAIPIYSKAIELYPELVGEGSAYAGLADAYRAEEDRAGERGVLERWVARDANALRARLRLTTILSEERAWAEAYTVAESTLAIQPLLPEVYRTLVQSGRESDRPADVVRHGRTLLALDPVDPAQVYYELALASRTAGDLASARRDVLLALAEAPRFRAAHRLLLEINRAISDEKGDDGG